MAESYVVQAILSVKDHMSAALKGAASAADSLNGGFKRTIGTGCTFCSWNAGRQYGAGYHEPMLAVRSTGMTS